MRKGAKLGLSPVVDDPVASMCDKPNRQMLIGNLPEPFWQIATHQACIHNEERALRNRVQMAVNQASPEITGLVTIVADQLARGLTASPIDGYEQLIGMFPPSRRKMYRKAFQELTEYAGSVDRLARVSAFVKSEKLSILSKDGDPRMIQARTKIFNLMLGLYTRAIEKSLYTLNDPQWLRRGIVQPLLAKGKNMLERASLLRQTWKLYRNPISLSLDLSRWDAHVGLPILKVMHKFYFRIIPSSVMKWLLKFQLINKGYSQQGLKYKNTGGVTSGDMTTALGNCVAACAIVLSCRQTLQLLAGKTGNGTSDERLRKRLNLLKRSPLFEGSTLHKLQLLVNKYLNSSEKRGKFCRQVPISVVDDGDDHVVITEKEWAPLVSEALELWWKDVGQELKVEGTTTRFHQIEFCQHKPHKLSTGQWIMCPNPYKVLATATVIAGNNRMTWKRYCMTIWEARAILHKGIPMLGPLFQKWSKKNWTRQRMSHEELMRSASGIEHLQMMNRKLILPRTITQEQRVMFEDQWGITPDEQERWERTDITKPTHITEVVMPVKVKSGLLRLIG